MAALKKSGTLTVVAMLVVAALAIAFWVALLGPKRDEASKLGTQVEEVESSLAQSQAEVASGEEARKGFPVDYQRLVVLGKSVPAGDETASLLVQLNGLADRAKVDFQDIGLGSEGGGGEEAVPAPASPSGEPVSATEAEAALLPLGASIGPAGLAVMPYSLTFTGDFFQIADFIKGLDSLVESNNENVAVKGRLITINDFTLTPEGESEEPGAASSKGGGSPKLSATFSVTAYVTPPGQGITGGASPSSPLEATATPASTTTGGAP
jgi:Tfp pilus assembly protein PilO